MEVCTLIRYIEEGTVTAERTPDIELRTTQLGGIAEFGFKFNECRQDDNLLKRWLTTTTS